MDTQKKTGLPWIFGALLVTAVALLMLGMTQHIDTKTCSGWAAEYRLDGGAETLVCATGNTHPGYEMTEEDFLRRMDNNLDFIKSIIDETGGL